MIEAEQYRQAYLAVEEWEEMPTKQRKGRTEPSGPWVRRVYANRNATLEAMFDENTDVLKAAGRV